VATDKHDLIACINVQTSFRVHQKIELALDIDKMHPFSKDPSNLRIEAVG
jgi:hypothetical protein